MLSSCSGSCGFGNLPPPDSILSMPPPPLPSFLIPKSAIAASPSNDSYPCFATFMCEPNPYPRESGIQFVELNRSYIGGLENTWFLVLITSCVGVVILGGLLAVILLKCRETLFSGCNFSYHDSNIKQGTMSALGEPSKSNPFLSGSLLYPCTSNNSRDTLQSQLANDSRVLWATLTPNGTRHFVSDYPSNYIADISNHYEVVEQRCKAHTTNLQDYVKRTPLKSFENNGFVDYDYEDPTPLMDSYHDDIDSGYQEPQEAIQSLPRSFNRLHGSSPTRSINPNMARLNYYHLNSRGQTNCGSSTMQRSQQYMTTLNRKPSLNRRISDASSYNGQNI